MKRTISAGSGSSRAGVCVLGRRRRCAATISAMGGRAGQGRGRQGEGLDWGRIAGRRSSPADGDGWSVLTLSKTDDDIAILVPRRVLRRRRPRRPEIDARDAEKAFGQSCAQPARRGKEMNDLWKADAVKLPARNIQPSPTPASARWRRIANWALTPRTARHGPGRIRAEVSPTRPARRDRPGCRTRGPRVSGLQASGQHCGSPAVRHSQPGRQGFEPGATAAAAARVFSTMPPWRSTSRVALLMIPLLFGSRSSRVLVVHLAPASRPTRDRPEPRPRWRRKSACAPSTASTSPARPVLAVESRASPADSARRSPPTAGRAGEKTLERMRDDRLNVLSEIFVSRSRSRSASSPRSGGSPSTRPDRRRVLLLLGADVLAGPAGDESCSASASAGCDSACVRSTTTCSLLGRMAIWRATWSAGRDRTSGARGISRFMRSGCSRSSARTTSAPRRARAAGRRGDLAPRAAQRVLRYHDPRPVDPRLIAGSVIFETTSSICHLSAAVMARTTDDPATS